MIICENTPALLKSIQYTAELSWSVCLSAVIMDIGYKLTYWQRKICRQFNCMSFFLETLCYSALTQLICLFVIHLGFFCTLLVTNVVILVFFYFRQTYNSNFNYRLFLVAKLLYNSKWLSVCLRRFVGHVDGRFFTYFKKNYSWFQEMLFKSSCPYSYLFFCDSLPMDVVILFIF